MREKEGGRREEVCVSCLFVVVIRGSHMIDTVDDEEAFAVSSTFQRLSALFRQKDFITQKECAFD